jgi:hypothetical protein
MWHRVVLQAVADISEEHIAFIFRAQFWVRGLFPLHRPQSEQSPPWLRTVSWSFYTVGRTPWTGISPSQCRYLRTEQHKHRVDVHITDIHALRGFEPTIPAIEQAKTVDALDRAATVSVGTPDIFRNFLPHGSKLIMWLQIKTDHFQFYIYSGSSCINISPHLKPSNLFI